MDYRQQMCFNLATSWLDPVFFACLLAPVGLALSGLPSGWPWVFMLIGLKVFRVGFDLEWPLPFSLGRQALQTRKKPEPLKSRQMVWLFLVLGVGFPVFLGGSILLPLVLWPGIDPMWTFGFAFGALMALAGLAGIAYKLFFLDEDTLRQRLREAPA